MLVSGRTRPLVKEFRCPVLVLALEIAEGFVCLFFWNGIAGSFILALMLVI